MIHAPDPRVLAGMHPVDWGRLSKFQRNFVSRVLAGLRSEGASETQLRNFTPTALRAASQAERARELEKAAEERKKMAPTPRPGEGESDDDDGPCWDDVGGGVRMYRAGKRRAAPVLFLKSYEEAAAAMRKGRR